MNVFSRVFDERFLAHRRQSTSIGGVAGGVLAALLFAYRYYFDHRWSWDLLAVALAIVLVKWAVLIWHLFTE